MARNESGSKIWYIQRSNQLGTFSAIQWGISEDLTVAEDYDGDGKTDFAVFCPSDGFWYVLRSSDSQLQAAQFGVSGDKPQPADYNGDGKADYAVFRPSIGTWFVARASGIPAQNFDSIQWGAATDIPISSLAALSN
ncbi:MAG TPA: VCBS repeat-containing protein [Pyrinomonadaceae bacterium]